MEPGQFLAAVRRRLTRTILVTGLARVVWLSIAGLLAVIVVDRFQSFPAPVRLVLLLVGVAAIALVVWRRLLRPLGQQLDDAAMARVVERRVPACNGRLFAVVDGIELSPDDRSALAEICSRRRVASLIRSDALRSALVGAAMTLITVVILLVASPGFLGTGVQRLLLPFSSITWPKSRALVAELRSPVVPSDQPLVLTAERTRGSPSRLTVGWTDLDGRSEQRYPDGLQGPWQEALTLDPGLYDITVATEDADPVHLQGRVVHRPSLRQLQLVVTPPAYTGQDPLVVDGANALTALQGSQVTLNFTVRQGVGIDRQTVGLRLGEDEVSLAQDEASVWTGSVAVDEDGELAIDLVDHYGSGSDSIAVRARPEVRIALTAEADRPPVVELLGVGNNEQVAPQARLPVRLQARDAIGLAGLALEATVSTTQVDEGQPATEPVTSELARFDQAVVGQRETTRSVDLHVGSVATEGQAIVLVGEARDANDISGPGIGRSDPITLLVVSVDELRQELDRHLAEARDRVSQARDHLSRGMADDEQLTPSARSARAIARRAGEQIDEVVRRWQANGLDADILPKLQRSGELVGDEAVPTLGEAAERDDADAARQQAGVADAKLSEAEATLTQLLRSGDLARQLHSLVTRQQQLNDATRKLVKKSLDQGLDETDKRQLQDLANRQGEQAQRLREWERRLLDTDAKHFDEARELVQQTQPSADLDQAGRELQEGGDPTRAPSHQQQGTDAMQQLLDSLRGGDQAARLGKRAGELAERQEGIQRELEDGKRPQDLQDRQRELQDETEQLLKDIEEQTDSEKAAESAKGATTSQEQAQGHMQQGKSSAAGAAAGAAAAQLRDVQRELNDEAQKQEQEEQEQAKKGADVLGLLRALIGDQRRVVTRASVLHETVLAWLRKQKAPLEYAGKDLKFRDKRDLGEIALLQEEVLLRLREEGIKHLEQAPIALRALHRVESAMDRSHRHLARPDLGERGLHLASVALAELARLLEIVDSLPEQQQGEGGQGNQGQGGNPPPFPPRAELGLLRAEQEHLSWLTAARKPADLAQQQVELLGLADLVAQQTRPGTRPHLLMHRVLRAMASSADLLERERRDGVTRTEQDAAVALLQRLMEEQKASGQGGQGSSSSQPRNKDRNQGQSKQSKADGNPQQSEGGGGQSASGNGSGNEANEPDSSVVAEGEVPVWVLALPLREQERVLQAMQDRIPPEAFTLYRAYLERLQENR